MVPVELEEVFLNQAQENTLRAIETCGILCGSLDTGKIIVSHLLIPPQHGTYNTVEMLEDGKVAMYLIDHNLQSIGWICYRASAKSVSTRSH